MAKNPHFRVLALTATPGNSVDSIQILVDGLHISRIEIRNEESLDLKAYLHKKVSLRSSSTEAIPQCRPELRPAYYCTR